MAIDPNSLPYLFGQIQAQLKMTDKKVDEIFLVLNGLPCETRGARLKSVENFVNEYKGNETFKTRSGLSFRQGLLISVISILLSSVIASVLSRVL